MRIFFDSLNSCVICITALVNNATRCIRIKKKDFNAVNPGKRSKATLVVAVTVGSGNPVKKYLIAALRALCRCERLLSWIYG